MTGTAPPPPLALLVALVALAVLSLNMFLPSLTDMSATFETSYSVISLAVAGYLALTALVQLLIGAVSDRVGRRAVVLGALAVFSVASVGCALSQNVTLFLLCRMVQGAVVAGSVMAPAMVRDTCAPQDAVRRLGQISLVMAVVPMLGPMAGGVIGAVLGWRSVFVLYAVLGAALWLTCRRVLAETRPPQARMTRPPLRSLLRLSRFWGFALCTAWSTAAFYVFLAGVPLVALRVYGLGPAALGLALGSITGGFAAGSFLATRIAHRWPLGRTILIARALPCFALSLGLVLAVADLGGLWSLLAATLVVGVANGLSLPSTTTGALSQCPALTGTAAGAAGALNMGTGALVTWGGGALVDHAPRPEVLLAAMLVLCLMSLGAAWTVRRV